MAISMKLKNMLRFVPSNKSTQHMQSDSVDKYLDIYMYCTDKNDNNQHLITIPLSTQFLQSRSCTYKVLAKHVYSMFFVLLLVLALKVKATSH